MSLVREALEKAEREAAARNAREKGLPSTLSAAGQPYRARRRSTVPGLFAALIVTVVTVAAIVWMASRPQAARPPAAELTTPAATASPSATTSPAPAASSVETPPRASLPAASAATDAKPPSAAISPSAAQEASARPSPPPAAAAPAPRQAASPAVQPRNAFPEPGAEEIARDLDLGNGASLHLGGIAWSEAAPLAYLDGRLLGVGESVAGFRIERIERHRVLLVSGQRRVWISLGTD